MNVSTILCGNHAQAAASTCSPLADAPLSRRESVAIPVSEHGRYVELFLEAELKDYLRHTGRKGIAKVRVVVTDVTGKRSMAKFRLNLDQTDLDWVGIEAA